MVNGEKKVSLTVSPDILQLVYLRLAQKQVPLIDRQEVLKSNSQDIVLTMSLLASNYHLLVEALSVFQAPTVELVHEEYVYDEKDIDVIITWKELANAVSTLRKKGLMVTGLNRLSFTLRDGNADGTLNPQVISAILRSQDIHALSIQLKKMGYERELTGFGQQSLINLQKAIKMILFDLL